jgi:spore coat polysaccharide biosynthesis predicted glycosyltransferase SpsG
MDVNTFASIEEYPELESILRALGVEAQPGYKPAPLSVKKRQKLARFINKFNCYCAQLDTMRKANVLIDKNYSLFKNGKADRNPSQLDVIAFSEMLWDRYQKKIEKELVGKYSEYLVGHVKGFIRARISVNAGLSDKRR